LRFTIFQDSHIGGRKVNQDRLAYSYSKDVLMMVIADGMGGHARGEIAAEIAVNTMTSRFQQEARTTLRRPHEFLESAIHSAHRAIVAFADQHDMLECPRTTVVGCIVQNGKACWAHSGDSRLYMVRNGRLAASTVDHSRVQQLIESGVITPAQAAVHPDRNKIYNCLGGVLPPLVTHSEEWSLKVGDTILLSTDGFWGPLDADFIAAKLEREDLLTLIPKLLDEAEQGGRRIRQPVRHRPHLGIAGRRRAAGDRHGDRTDAGLHHLRAQYLAARLAVQGRHFRR
jgi:serine/threonine protein phosphatase PrpC